MTKKIRILVIVMALMLLSGCAANNQVPKDSFSESNPKQTEEVRQEKPERKEDGKTFPEEEPTTNEEEKGNTGIVSTPPEQVVEKPKQPEKKPESKPQHTDAPTSQPTVPPAEEPVTTNPTKPEETEPIKPTEPPVPENTQPPVSEPEKPQESKPAPEKPAIQIDDYIAYGQSYAKSVGLNLNPEAIYCWDTPITATDPEYLKRDIRDTMDWYVQSCDISEVWLWAEDDGKGGYLLYIGYA